MIPVPFDYTAPKSLDEAVALLEKNGEVISTSTGASVQGSPVNAVVWLVQDMAREGRALKQGDLISLGSFSKLLPPKAGRAVEVVYQFSRYFEHSQRALETLMSSLVERNMLSLAHSVALLKM